MEQYYVLAARMLKPLNGGSFLSSYLGLCEEVEN